MSKKNRFKEFDREKFKWAIDNYPWRRKITQVHVHHTWRPTKKQWQGLRHVVGMWRYHTKTKGWSDIAQHVTIAPDGGIWTGRNWNRPPVSSGRHNGNSRRGPFMFETVGNFDTGEEVLEGEQLKSVVFVIAYIQHKFKLPLSSMKFHRQLGSKKTCPGSGISYDHLAKLVQEYKTSQGWD